MGRLTYGMLLTRFRVVYRNVIPAGLPACFTIQSLSLSLSRLTPWPSDEWRHLLPAAGTTATPRGRPVAEV